MLKGVDNLKKKSVFFWWKIGITVVSFFAVIAFGSNIDWSNFSNNYVDPVLLKEIAYDLSIGIFSAMVLVWFIDEISNHIQERQSNNAEVEIIKRFDKILQCYIEQYIVLFYCVATPIEERNFKNVSMPERFTLKDMKDLHKTSLLMTEKVYGASVESFLQIELELRKEFQFFTEKCNFEFYPQIPQIFLEYIRVSISYDSRGAIFDAKNMTSGKQKMTDLIHDILESSADNLREKMLKGEDRGGNLADPYIFLYEMMRQERGLILMYQKEIEKLK